MKFWLIVSGVSILGYLIPEIFAAFGKVVVPTMQNIMCSLGCALIAAGLLV